MKNLKFNFIVGLFLVIILNVSIYAAGSQLWVSQNVVFNTTNNVKFVLFNQSRTDLDDKKQVVYYVDPTILYKINDQFSFGIAHRIVFTPEYDYYAPHLNLIYTYKVNDNIKISYRNRVYFEVKNKYNVIDRNKLTLKYVYNQFSPFIAGEIYSIYLNNSDLREEFKQYELSVGSSYKITNNSTLVLYYLHKATKNDDDDDEYSRVNVIGTTLNLTIK